MTARICIVVANRPRLMRDLVLEAIVEQSDIEILAEIQSEPDIPRVVDETRPDLLIVALDDSNQRPAICDTLLRQSSAMKILAVAPERNSSIFYGASSDIHSYAVEFSEVGILSTLRGEVQCV
jgi:chemotaxis response regulator CheB